VYYEKPTILDHALKLGSEQDSSGFALLRLSYPKWSVVVHWKIFPFEDGSSFSASALASVPLIIYGTHSLSIDEARTLPTAPPPLTEPQPRLLYPPVFLLVAIVAMVALDRLVPGDQVLSRPLTWFGLLPAMAGVAVTLWAARIFKRAGTPLRPFEASSVLVAWGPYRFTRNPMYLGMVLLLAGLAFGLGSLAPLPVVALFAWALTMRFIRREERILEDRFGDAYRTFKGSVRRWL
jgi:protein-S-isoprenylcysteine O-methyltransferase Ste14